MAGYNAFNKVCMSAGFNKMAPKADLKMLFLFLNEACLEIRRVDV